MDLITFALVLAATLIIAVNLVAIYWFGSMLIPLASGEAPYVPTRPEIMERIAMGRIKKLLESQLAPGSRVVSHAFKIPGWEPDEVDGNVMLYKIK